MYLKVVAILKECSFRRRLPLKLSSFGWTIWRSMQNQTLSLQLLETNAILKGSEKFSSRVWRVDSRYPYKGFSVFLQSVFSVYFIRRTQITTGKWLFCFIAEALQYATRQNALFVETSAKTSVNIATLFIEISKNFNDISVSKLLQLMRPWWVHSTTWNQQL